MDDVEFKRKYEYYRDNQYQFIIDFCGKHLFWYQKLILKMMCKKDTIINGSRVRKTQ